MRGHEMNKIPVEPEHVAELSLAEFRRAPGDRVEHGLDVGRRTRDYAQYLGGCCLIFKGFLQLALTRLLGFEQPRVLDGDDGLVGEGVDEFDLAFGEGAHFFLKRTLPGVGVIIPFGEEVSDVNRSPVDDGTRANGPTHKGYRELSDRAARGNLPMVRDEAQTIPKYLKHYGVIRIAQSRRGLDQRIKYPLQIEGRPADDLQNVGGGRHRASVSSRVLDCTSSNSRVF